MSEDKDKKDPLEETILAMGRLKAKQEEQEKEISDLKARMESTQTRIGHVEVFLKSATEEGAKAMQEFFADAKESTPNGEGEAREESTESP